MKRISQQLSALLLGAVVVFASCQKTSDVKKSNEVNPAYKASLISTLSQTDLSLKAPGESWWTDEYSTSARQDGGRGSLTTFTFLRAALDLTGLDDVLSDPNTIYTLFAPSDQAFIDAGFPTKDDLLALGSDALTPILLYHVVGGAKVFAADVTDGPATTLNTAQIFLTEGKGDNEKVFVNGFGIYIADEETDNGVIHTLNKVLFPPSQNLVELAIATPDLSYLVAAVLTASTGSTDVAAVLSGEGPFTLFAPTNQAFINAGFATIEDIQAADPDALAGILTYHVLNSRVYACDIPNIGLSPTMLSGGITDITTEITTDEFRNRRAIFVKGASNATASLVIGKNLTTTNGVAHVIDQVLLP